MLGQPLTDPDRPDKPLTIRRCASTKNASAGSIDSAVNAKIAAVFCEYVDWNVATPSGSVKCAGVVNTRNGSRYCSKRTNVRQDGQGKETLALSHPFRAQMPQTVAHKLVCLRR